MLTFAHKVVVALMLCIAILLARLDVQPSPRHPIKETSTSLSSDRKGQWEKWSEPITVVTFLLVIVGTGQLLLIWRQYSQTGFLERAYINAEPAGINPFIDEKGANILGHVSFINVGRMPARSVTYGRPQIIWSPQILEEHQLVPHKEKPVKLVLPPAARMPIGTESYSSKNFGKDGFFYVWGIIEYTDGFEKPRFTQFCHRYPSKPFDLSADGTKRIDAKYARYHEHGNDAN
jgi:hypothetical protein